MASAIISVIGGVLTIVDAVQTIRGWVVGGAPQVIIFKELQDVVQGEHAAFFQVIAFGRLDYRYRRFYGVCSRPSQDSIADVDMTLNLIRKVYEERYNVLHMDDVTRGFFASLSGYGLLFHMHGVYSQLNRLRLGAVDLEDRRLVVDSLNGLQYIYDAAGLIGWFGNNNIIQNKRMGLVPEQVTHVNSIFWRYWNYQERYTPLSNVSPNLELSVARPPAYYEHNEVNNVRGALRDRRARVDERVRFIVFNVYSPIWWRLDRTRTVLQARARSQGATRVVPRRRPVRSLSGLSRAMPFSVIEASVDDTGNENEVAEFEDGVGGFSDGGEPEDPNAPDGDPFSITAPEVVADAEEKTPAERNIALDSSRLGETTKLTVYVS
ncbi:uncharacterized protein T069G_10917 [Trichoderma breve]|uniref:Uncharacterized protein n=1 Tax=Trichoderma breve TaxID=2034170 RepID=A0A9W9B4B0_9HYPO|nr:uncharacterized protein T069G_10917 [Trichoderma breve]KAJ4855359.1 hypothetical protein T069G_10917 [Trichoderma breve]